ncbi:hypothetical protein PMAYCL1PPCAC_21420, partial [Pristionchus mayeri]
SCCQCCQVLVEVEAPPGVVIGTVVQQSGACDPLYVGRDNSDQNIFDIVCMMCSCSDKVFEVRDGRGYMGEVRRRWAGILNETLTKDHNNFGVSFPTEMPVIHKAILIGATFLV